MVSGAAVLSAVDHFYISFPYAAAFLTCGVKAACSDTIAQFQQRNETARSGFDYLRNVAFLLYGGLYQGIAQYVIFNQIFPVVFGTGTDWITVLTKVTFDQLVLTPFLCLPIAYLVKAAVFRQPLVEGFRRYIADAKADLLWKYWAIWTPTQCLTFSVVPDHLRIAFIAVVSFFWLILLSTISSRPALAEAESDVAAVACDSGLVVPECIYVPDEESNYSAESVSEPGESKEDYIAMP